MIWDVQKINELTQNRDSSVFRRSQSVKNLKESRDMLAVPSLPIEERKMRKEPSDPVNAIDFDNTPESF